MANTMKHPFSYKALPYFQRRQEQNKNIFRLLTLKKILNTAA